MPRRLARRRWRALVLASSVVLLGACRVDSTVTVDIAKDGSGTIALTLVADADIVKDAPDLATDLRLDDLTAAGWVATGPQPTDAGGLRLVLTHPFTSPAEATALLAQLNGTDGPIRELVVRQDRSFALVATGMTGHIDLSGGLASFADDDVIAKIGGEPYRATLDSRDIEPGDTFAITLVATAPGVLIQSDGESVPAENGTSSVTWHAGSAATASQSVPITLKAALRDGRARRAGRLEQFAPWAIAAWLVFVVGVVLPALALRRRRRPS
jgi:hypothetical protein